jgi:hypothetical protein
MLAIIASALLLCDHGPGTSGGGVGTQSGETLGPSKMTLTWRQDYTQYERLSSDDIESRTMKMSGEDHAHFDALRWSLLETLEISYGLAEDWQFGYSLGWYKGNDLREGHLHEDGSYGYHEYGDISGMTDHWMTLKHRVLKGESGHLAFTAGIKLPFGDDDEIGEDGTRNAPLEASLQPGSGTFDFLFGAAFSRYLTPNVTLDTSLSYTARTIEDDYKIGDLILYGLAVAYRFSENAASTPSASVFLELNLRHLFHNEEDDEEVHNSGGTVLFLSPGVKIAFTPGAAFTLSLQFPIVQDLEDEQQETDFKATTALTLSF